MSEQENSEFKKIFTFSRNSPGDSVPLQVTKKPFTAGAAPQIEGRDGSGLKPAAQKPSIPQAPDVSSLANPVITLPQSGNTLNRAGASAQNPGAAPATSGPLPTIPGTPPKLPGTLPTIPGTPPKLPDTLPTVPGTPPKLPGTLPTIPGTPPAPSGTLPTIPGTPPKLPGTLPTIPGTPPASSGSLPTIPGTPPGSSPTLPGEVAGGLRSSASSPQSGLPSQPGEANPAAGPSLKLPGVPLKAPTVSAPQSGVGLVSQITSAAPPAQQAGAPQTPPSISGTPLINVTSKSLDSLAAGTGVPKAYANAMREKVSYMLNFQVKVTSLTKHLRGLMRKTARQGDGDASATPPAGPGQ